MDLAKAKQYYQSIGYKYVDVPTLVSGEVINATCPPWGDFKPIGGLHHVASAEQSFLQMLVDGNNLKGRYQAITACHRASDKDRGNLYLDWFIKLELFSSEPSDYLVMLNHARHCYAQTIEVSEEHIKTVETEQGLDLFFDQIEIGSYGEREAMGFKWAYGTGFVPFRLGVVKSLVLTEKAMEPWK